MNGKWFLKCLVSPFCDAISRSRSERGKGKGKGKERKAKEPGFNDASFLFSFFFFG